MIDRLSFKQDKHLNYVQDPWLKSFRKSFLILQPWTEHGVVVLSVDFLFFFFPCFCVFGFLCYLINPFDSSARVFISSSVTLLCVLPVSPEKLHLFVFSSSVLAAVSLPLPLTSVLPQFPVIRLGPPHVYLQFFLLSCKVALMSAFCFTVNNFVFKLLWGHLGPNFHQPPSTAGVWTHTHQGTLLPD